MVRLNRITAAMVAAFKAGERYELHYRLLRRKPWQENIMDVVCDDPPAYLAGNGPSHAQNARTWAEARRLRLMLEEAAR